MHAGGEINVFENDSDLDIPPHDFVEKQVVAVAINDAYMEGEQGIPYTRCEVYAPTHYMSNVCHELD
jgi:hypothetical protein